MSSAARPVLALLPSTVPRPRPSVRATGASTPRRKSYASSRTRRISRSSSRRCRRWPRSSTHSTASTSTSSRAIRISAIDVSRRACRPTWSGVSSASSFGCWKSAFLAQEPSSPNRPLLVAMGVIFGLAMSARGGHPARSRGHHGAQRMRQLQGQFELPVLAAIPQIWLESDRLRVRRARIKRVYATVAVTVFVAIGGYANYWWVNTPRRLAPSRDETATSQVESPGRRRPRQPARLEE